MSDIIKIVFIGDIFGRPGRESLYKNIKVLSSKYDPDLIITNGENASHGFGINLSQTKEFFSKGVDVITTGNHIWDQKEILQHINSIPNLIRPHNYAPNLPGRGYVDYKLRSGKGIIKVINLSGTIGMKGASNAFFCADTIIGKVSPTQQGYAAIFVDFHAEATSEKNALGHYLDGRVSAVIGTHTHIPTRDSKILPKGTAYMTDVGMTGVYNSVIGMDIEDSTQRFLDVTSAPRMEPQDGLASLCGVYIEVSRKTGLAGKITPIKID